MITAFCVLWALGTTVALAFACVTVVRASSHWISGISYAFLVVVLWLMILIAIYKTWSSP